MKTQFCVLNKAQETQNLENWKKSEQRITENVIDLTRAFHVRAALI